VEVETSEVQVKHLLAKVLTRPALVAEWNKGALTKRRPESTQEAVVARLKRFLTRPYFASRTKPKSFDPIYQTRVEVTLP
jgi:hypothetical protein